MEKINKRIMEEKMYWKNQPKPFVMSFGLFNFDELNVSIKKGKKI